MTHRNRQKHQPAILNEYPVTPTTYRKLIATELTTDFRKAAEIVEMPFPEPGPGEVVVQNKFAGVNATDVNITAGRYAPDAEPPLDLGAEAVGVVVATGSAVKHVREGDAVVTGNLGGGYREYNVLPAHQAIPVPEATPEALTVMVSGLTASIALHEVGGMRQGETVLVTAAAGGTGQYAVQLAKLAGNHVAGTCGSAAKAEFLRGLGCDRPINYRNEDVATVLRAEYPRGVNLIYESVGGALFDTCVDALALRGRLLSIGFISEYVDGPKAVPRPRLYTKLLAKSASVRGFFLPHFREYYRDHTERLFGLLREGRLRVAIDPTVFEGLEAVPDAVEYLHRGENVGKVVVRF